MNAIVVVDKNWAIGRNGGLLAHIPGDLKYYKRRTLFKHIIIGRKTLESFPGAKPLPARENIVLTGNPAYEAEGCTVVHSLDELDAHLADLPTEDVFVSGGGEIYRQLLDRCDTFYVTHIEHAFDDADTYFEDITKWDDIVVAWKSDVYEQNGLRYYFVEYKRQAKKK